MMIGSRKYPTERESGQSCVIGPPSMIPGFTRIAVPASRHELEPAREDSGLRTRDGYFYDSAIRYSFQEPQEANFII